LRHPILYAEQMWQKQRFWALALIVIGVFASSWLFYANRRLDNNLTVFLLYIPAGLLALGIFLYYRVRHRLETGEDGVVIRNLFSTVRIEYDSIRSVRVAPLEGHFQEGFKSQQRIPVIRPLLKEPAIFIRLRGDDEELARIGRRLGSRIYHAGLIALPVADPASVADQINEHLPERAGRQGNLGGARRRRRR
jgi:hypothetical protein